VESIVRRLRTQNLKGRIEAFHLQCESLAKAFDEAKTNRQRAEIAHEWAKAVRAKRTVQVLLALKERQERESAMRR
jgi:hypothetical protein